MTNRAIRVSEEEYDWLKTRRDGGAPPAVSEGSKFDMGETDDGLTINSVSDRIRTVDQALEYAKIDTAIWEVAKAKVGSWEVAMKLRQGDSDKPITRQLWKVEITAQEASAKACPRWYGSFDGPHEGMGTIISQDQAKQAKRPSYAGSVSV